MRFPWFGWRAKAEARAQAEEAAWRAEIDATFKRERELLDAGWVSFSRPQRGDPSPFGLLIDIIDPDGTIHTLPYDDMHPAMNVAGRFWRPSVFAEPGKTIEGSLTPTGLLH